MRCHASLVIHHRLCRRLLSRLGLVNNDLLPAKAFTANTVGRRGVKTLLHEFFQRHPFTLEVNLPAPRANAHEFLEIMDALQNPPRGPGHQKPNAENQKYVQRRPAVDEGEWMVGKYKPGQLQKIVQKTKHDDAQKTEVLIQLDLRQLRILFHTSKMIRGS